MKSKHFNPAFCPYCKKLTPVVPLDSTLGISICINCRRLFHEGQEIEMVPKKPDNPSKRYIRKRK